MEFARGLVELGIEIVSTGGTARELEEEGIDTRPVEDYTGFPEILDGRVKTLNPRIYAGLLAVRSDPDHVETLNAHEVEPIDLVCVNLYPFERVSGRRGVEDAEVIENIDIGGPTLIRAAAKNNAFAAVVVGPESYDAVLDELQESDRRLSLRTRQSLAMEAFAYTARYDAAISRWFAEREEDFPAQYTRSFEKVLDLSYGENPHQRAAYYAETGARTHLMSMVSKLHGKELSFNNLLDLDSGRQLIEDFELPAVAIIKHNNPCGAAVGAGAGRCVRQGARHRSSERVRRSVLLQPSGGPGARREAQRDLRGGGVRARLRRGRARAAPAEAERAAAREPGAAHHADLGARHQARARRHPRAGPGHGAGAARRDAGGHHAQADARRSGESCCSRMRVCKHVRSNAIVMSKGLGTIGIGAGQMSRVDSVRIAVEKAAAAGLSLDGAAMASDAFFPFADGPQLAIDAGVRAIIQPGGSQRDHEVVEACDAAGVAMVFTARRHFRH